MSFFLELWLLTTPGVPDGGRPSNTDLTGELFEIIAFGVGANGIRERRGVRRGSRWLDSGRCCWWLWCWFAGGGRGRRRGSLAWLFSSSLIVECGFKYPMSTIGIGVRH